ncbi:hypothetical protein MMC30_000233 [Trapelia coarctata]|nr:hypothetical protein [Trapelia coarctata]
MRGKRSKQYRKLMQQYNLTFGFREPYQVLVDVQMLLDTSRFKMDLIAGLERTLHGQVKPSTLFSIPHLLNEPKHPALVITQCTIRHLFLLPTASSNPTTTIPVSSTPSHPPPPSPLITPPITPQTKTALLALARTFERRRCNHHTLDTPLSTLACFSSVIDPKSSLTNKNHYILASQDEEVRRWARGVRGVPSVYVKRSIMVMEPMSEGSAGVREGMERGKLRGGVRGKGVGVGDKGGLGKRKRGEEDGEGEGGGEEQGKEEGERKKRRVRGPKGPNPLSVRKPKGKGEGGGVKIGEDGAGSKSNERAGEAQEKGEKHGADGAELMESAGNKKKRKRKHKSGTTAMGDVGRDVILELG